MSGSDATLQKSSNAAAQPFSVTSDPTVQITVYDAAQSMRGRAEGLLELRLPLGLYRVLFERAGAIEQQIVDHEAETRLVHPGPPLRSPVPFRGAATTDAFAERSAFNASNITPFNTPLGQPTTQCRLFVFCRRMRLDGRPAERASHPLSAYDVNGRWLANLEHPMALVGGVDYLAYSCFARAGTYRLRAERSRREIAITIPAGRAAHVFLVDTGAIRLEDARVSLVPIDAPFDPTSPLWAVMECVLAALRTRGRPLPRAARDLLPSAAEHDLCFGIAAAHLLLRAGERRAFQMLLDRLERHRELPDVAILLAADRAPSSSFVRAAFDRARRALWRGRGDSTRRLPEAPPLLRASLVLALTKPGFDTATLSPACAFAEAARRQLPDSAWCTWSTRTWDERWIVPTVDRLLAHGRVPDATSIGHRLALPASTVAQALNELARAQTGEALTGMVSGYFIHEVLGRGAASTVFRAHRQSDGQAVALKIIPGVAAARRFDSAARDQTAAEDAPGPNVIPASALGRLPGKMGVWIEMELCKGSLLDHVAEENTPMSPPDAVRCVQSALRGLVEIHNRGSVHGRISPANLLIRDDGSVAIADLDPDARSWWRGGAEGWPDLRFVAPELLSTDGQCSQEGDLWAMAATLYFLLTLEAPRPEYAGQSRLEAMQQNPALPIAVHRPDLHSELASFIDRALSRVANEPPRDAASFSFGLGARQWLGALDAAAENRSPPQLAQGIGPEIPKVTATVRVNDSTKMSPWSLRRLLGNRSEHMAGEQVELDVGIGENQVELELGIGGAHQQLWVRLAATASRPVPCFGLSEQGPFFAGRISWCHRRHALFIDFQLPDGVAQIRSSQLMHSRPIAGHQQMCIPAIDGEYDLEIELGPRAERKGLPPSVVAFADLPIWAYDPLLRLPAGGVPQTIFVKLVEGGDHLMTGFSLHASGPYHVGGCSWECRDEPLFVTFRLADRIEEISCSTLPYSEPRSGTQYMCIPPQGATYDLAVQFAPSVPRESLAVDVALKFVVVPGPGTSGGGGGGAGLGWSGSQPVPTIS